MTTPAHAGIVILGTPRSGTTLLRRILGAHPNIAAMGESNLLGACARFLDSERIAEDVEIGVLAGLGQAGFPRDEVLSRLRDFAFAFHRDHAARLGKPRWAEKTAFDAFHVAGIEALCGEHAYFLCVVRHGLDVACSLQELSEKNGGYLRELHDYVRQQPRPLEAFAHAWVDMTRAIRAFAARHRRNALLLRYEDLVANPSDVLAGAFRFIGESFEPALLERRCRTPGTSASATGRPMPAARSGPKASAAGDRCRAGPAASSERSSTRHSQNAAMSPFHWKAGATRRRPGAATKLACYSGGRARAPETSPDAATCVDPPGRPPVESPPLAGG